jgi:hypothetical protein
MHLQEPSLALALALVSSLVALWSSPFDFPKVPYPTTTTPREEEKEAAEWGSL